MWTFGLHNDAGRVFSQRENYEENRGNKFGALKTAHRGTVSRTPPSNRSSPARFDLRNQLGSNYLKRALAYPAPTRCNHLRGNAFRLSANCNNHLPFACIPIHPALILPMTSPTRMSQIRESCGLPPRSRCCCASQRCKYSRRIKLFHRIHCRKTPPSPDVTPRDRTVVLVKLVPLADGGDRSASSKFRRRWRNWKAAELAGARGGRESSPQGLPQGPCLCGSRLWRPHPDSN